MTAVRTVPRLVIHPFNLAFVCALALGASPAAAERPVHTFSIVARDSITGQLGVAVQSHWFSVGSVVTWAEAGVGAVATQSFAEPAYGPRGLALMNSGLDAPSALRALIAADPAQEVRQVAFVDARGRVAAHTGAKCIETAGHHVGRGWSVQANMMLGDGVVPAMAAACEAATTAGADLPERLLRALEAAQGAGATSAACSRPRSWSWPARPPDARPTTACSNCGWRTARRRCRSCGGWSACGGPMAA